MLATELLDRNESEVKTKGSPEWREIDGVRKRGREVVGVERCFVLLKSGRIVKGEKLDARRTGEMVG
jgi:hypothetical protein